MYRMKLYLNNWLGQNSSGLKFSLSPFTHTLIHASMQVLAHKCETHTHTLKIDMCICTHTHKRKERTDYSKGKYRYCHVFPLGSVRLVSQWNARCCQTLWNLLLSYSLLGALQIMIRTVLIYCSRVLAHACNTFSLSTCL